MPSSKKRLNVLIIGSGGREHAIAWKVAQSPRLNQLYIAPGNPGTAQVGTNIPIHQEDSTSLVVFAGKNEIDLVIIGPEAPLANGLSDQMRAAGIPTFGPSQSAAQIETSKVFAKEFMLRQNIPSARFVVFYNFDEAVDYLQNIDYPVVIKASGLAAGKGVMVPDSLKDARTALHAIMVDKEFGAAGEQVVIEERLYGEEVSIIAFTDGKKVCPMLPAQDHKRLLDSDRGPNTGGMGAFSPVPSCPPELVAEVSQSILEPAVWGLASEGLPFCGVLYAGLMITQDGPRVLEFNCRFGDPETQAVLPLLDSDLLDIVEACVAGDLGSVDVRWKQGSAACVVLASEGYPGKVNSGYEIIGLEQSCKNAVVFHAGTKMAHNKLVNSGGRVLGVTGWGSTLKEALDTAYDAVNQIHFKGMQYRKDIAHHALANPPSAYGRAGVSIDSGNRAVELMSSAVRSTYTPQVLAGIGAFGGLFDASVLKDMKNPVLVASTDGVGTKVKLAAQVGRYQSIGEDIVNHCINDILVQGASPLFFMDYFATSRLNPEIVAEVVTGISTACRSAGCVLLGGETAEMPGVYQAGEFDVAGTIIGIVEREHILPRQDLQPGDILIGLRSSGAHTNGYSLIRKVFEDTPLDTIFPELGRPLIDVLLAPHRSYLPVLQKILKDNPSLVKALAHLTGGGFIENIPRVLPNNLDVEIDLNSWVVPPLFRLIQTRGNIPEQEMYRVFNMGIGMVVIVDAEDAKKLQESIEEETWIIGKLIAGNGTVNLI